LDVIDLAVVSTPGAKVAARAAGASGAVIVTGSHLADDLNGLKLVAAPRWAPVDSRGLPPPTPRAPGRGRRHEEPRAAELHAEAVCAAVDAAAIRAAAPAVELTGGAGDGAAIALEMLGCAAGDPPDLRLALDADADRATLGELDSELTLMLAVAAREPELVVRSSDTSRAIDDMQAQRGARTVVVAPGELHLVEALGESSSALAGEGNGGVIVPAAGPGRDGLAAGALALELMARTGKPLAELASSLPTYARSRSSVPCADPGSAAARLAAAADALSAAAPDDPETGLSVERDGAWGLIRRSATEPVLRVTAEAPRAEAAADLHDELVALL
jgi:phosphomannomutase